MGQKLATLGLVLVCAGCSAQPVAKATAPTEPAPEPSPLTCRAIGTECALPSECCDGNCQPLPGQGHVCKEPGAGAACRPEGFDCSLGSQCCSQHCTADGGGTSTCKPAGARLGCIPRSQPCALDAECCSERCVAGADAGRSCK